VLKVSLNSNQSLVIVTLACRRQYVSEAGYGDVLHRSAAIDDIDA